MEIGLLHPGEMGAAVGAVLRGAGHTVSWVSTGRSAASAARADEAGLSPAGSLAELADRCEVIVAVCPPHAALDVAAEVVAAGFTGRYLDANAIAPGTAEAVRALVERDGARYVDGGIIGSPPPSERSSLYLSGPDAAGLAEDLGETGLRTIVLGGPVTAASALKMAYAAWTKGTAALLLAIRALGEGHGVTEALAAEWERSQPELGARSRQAARAAIAKGWRWSGEMEEVARSLAELGLPGGFGQAAAEVYRAVPRGVPSGDDRDLDAAVRELTSRMPAPPVGGPPELSAGPGAAPAGRA